MEFKKTMKNPELEIIGNFKFLEYYFHLTIEREYYDIAGLCDIEIVKKINMNFIQNEESIIVNKSFNKYFRHGDYKLPCVKY